MIRAPWGAPGWRTVDNRNNNTHVRSIHRSRSCLSWLSAPRRITLNSLHHRIALVPSSHRLPSHDFETSHWLWIEFFRHILPRLLRTTIFSEHFLTLSVVPIYLFFLRENWFSWDLHDINESLVSNCASYAAFERYTSGTDLYILPRTPGDLLNLL